MYYIEIGERNDRGNIGNRQVLLVTSFSEVANPDQDRDRPCAVTVSTEYGPHNFPIKYDVFKDALERAAGKNEPLKLSREGLRKLDYASYPNIRRPV